MYKLRTSDDKFRASNEKFRTSDDDQSECSHVIMYLNLGSLGRQVLALMQVHPKESLGRAIHDSKVV